jgi:hypothetical protein
LIFFIVSIWDILKGEDYIVIGRLGMLFEVKRNREAQINSGTPCKLKRLDPSSPKP